MVLLVRSARPACEATTLVREAAAKRGEKLIYLRELPPETAPADLLWARAKSEIRSIDQKNHALVCIDGTYFVNPTQQDVDDHLARLGY